MSNLWLNVRVFRWHLQIGPDRPWVAIRVNRHFKLAWPWFEAHR